MSEATNQLQKRSDKETICTDGKITVRLLREWLATLPEEFLDAEFESTLAGFPVSLKRIVAYRTKDGSCKGVCTNSMGTHLPFDDSLIWEHVLS